MLWLKEVAGMAIEKNIIETLKREMDKRGVNYVGLSNEIGIPRSTLHGYLKGTSHPRSDSLDELAKRLGISIAELVSGTEYPHTGISCIDQMFWELPRLHPLVFPIAREAVFLLQTMFSMSDAMYDVDGHLTNKGVTEATYRYCLHELRDSSFCIPSYGIVMEQRLEDRWSTVAVVSPISRDRASVIRLIDLCSKLQLSPEHLLDVVQDFLTMEYLST